MLWRISAVATIASPVIWVALFATLLIQERGYAQTRRFSNVLLPVSGVGVIVYLLARLILLVLAFIGLRSLSPAVYQNVYWTTFIPHI